MIGAGITGLVGMWFALQADIAEAKELPAPPPAEVTRMEYDMKEQLIRQTIMTTQEDVKELKGSTQSQIWTLIGILGTAVIGTLIRFVITAYPGNP